jgi:hypothetical protein
VALAPLRTHNHVTLPVELECLAIVWAIQKCSFWLKGLQTFRIITDHNPLLGVFSKPLGEIENPRLLRMRLRVASYTFTLTWQEGKKHLIADALSRAPYLVSLLR